jgi:hyperosmotically inducible periplasmic protein
MNKLTTLFLSSMLLVGTVACSDTAKTSSNAPDTAGKTGEVPTAGATQTNKDDATSKVRRDQLNSDLRARAQRNDAGGGGTTINNDDLSSAVRSKLEANIPNGKLTVVAKDGAVTVAGSVPVQNQLAKIEPLVKGIKGVKSVKVAAKVVPSAPATN